MLKTQTKFGDVSQQPVGSLGDDKHLAKIPLRLPEARSDFFFGSIVAVFWQHICYTAMFWGKGHFF